MAFVRLAVFFIIAAFFVNPAAAGDARPPQLQISFLAEPAPIVQYGSTKLVYEMVVTNFSKRSYAFDAIETKAGPSQFSFSGAALATMMSHLGPWDPVAGPASRTIAAGRSLILYFMLDLGEGKAPQAIEHSLHMIADDGSTHDIVLRPLSVSQENPMVVAPPLRGVWIAGELGQ